MGAAIERLVAHVAAGTPGNPDRQQDLAVERALADRVVAVVGAVEQLIRPDMDAVGALEHALAPGPQEVAVAVEHDHRVFAAVEDIDVVVAVDAHRADLLQAPSVGQLAPALLDPIAVLAAAQNDGHCISSCRFGYPGTNA